MNKRHQTLDNYFSVKYPLNASYFIYDPDSKRAYYTSDSNECTHFKFVVKQKLKEEWVYLFIKPVTSSKEVNLPEVTTPYTIPLLKSNLQKAIRRKHTSVAIHTALAILQSDPNELLRRFPIICIEDVIPHPFINVLVWLMIANKNYPIQSLDMYSILCFVKWLCECPTSIPNILEEDTIRSLEYRELYGGMKGDMTLIQEVITKNESCRNGIEYKLHDTIWIKWLNDVELLPESVDFHPYPSLLTIISKQTGISSSQVKELIWVGESAVNVRKPDTIKMSLEIKSTEEWKRIEKKLNQYRERILELN